MDREADYLRKAADLRRQARTERNVSTRFDLELLAIAYDRLVDQARRNANTTVMYDPQSDKMHRLRRAQAQQQQQRQPAKWGR